MDTKKTTMTSFQLPVAMLERLRARAKLLDLNVAQAIRRAILLWLKATEPTEE